MTVSFFILTYKQTQQLTSSFTCQFENFKDAFINCFWKTVLYPYDEFVISIAHKITPGTVYSVIQMSSTGSGSSRFTNQRAKLPDVWDCMIIIFLFFRIKKIIIKWRVFFWILLSTTDICEKPDIFGRSITFSYVGCYSLSLPLR